MTPEMQESLVMFLKFQQIFVYGLSVFALFGILILVVTLVQILYAVIYWRSHVIKGVHEMEDKLRASLDSSSKYESELKAHGMEIINSLKEHLQKYDQQK